MSQDRSKSDGTDAEAMAGSKTCDPTDSFGEIHHGIGQTELSGDDAANTNREPSAGENMTSAPLNDNDGEDRGGEVPGSLRYLIDRGYSREEVLRLSQLRDGVNDPDSLRDLIGRGYSHEEVLRFSRLGSSVEERMVGVQSINERVRPSLLRLPDDSVDPTIHGDSPPPNVSDDEIGYKSSDLVSQEQSSDNFGSDDDVQTTFFSVASTTGPDNTSTIVPRDRSQKIEVKVEEGPLLITDHSRRIQIRYALLPPADSDSENTGSDDAQGKKTLLELCQACPRCTDKFDEAEKYSSWNAVREWFEEHPRLEHADALEERTDSDEGRLTPLHLACSKNAPIDVVEKMLNLKGCKAEDNEKRLPLHWACDAHCSPELVWAVFERYPAGAEKTNESRSTAHTTPFQGHRDVARKLIKFIVECKGQCKGPNSQCYFRLNLSKDHLPSEIFEKAVLENCDSPNCIAWLNIMSCKRKLVGFMMLEFYLHAALIVSFSQASIHHITDKNPSPGWAIAMFPIATAFLLLEFVQMWKRREQYILDFWNWVDCTTIALVFASATKLLVEEPGVDSNFSTTTTGRLLMVTGVFILVFFLSYLKKTFFSFSTFVGGIANIMWVLFPFIVVSLLFLGAFAFMHFVQDHTPEIQGSFEASSYEVYTTFLAGPDETESALDVFFGGLIVVVLLNVVIAIVAQAWSDVTKNAEEVFWKYRLRFIIEYTRGDNDKEDGQQLSEGLGHVPRLRRFLDNDWTTSNLKQYFGVSDDSDKKQPLPFLNPKKRAMGIRERDSIFEIVMTILLLSGSLVLGLVSFGFLWPKFVLDFLFTSKLWSKPRKELDAQVLMLRKESEKQKAIIEKLVSDNREQTQNLIDVDGRTKKLVSDNREQTQKLIAVDGRTVTLVSELAKLTSMMQKVIEQSDRSNFDESENTSQDETPKCEDHQQQKQRPPEDIDLDMFQYSSSANDEDATLSDHTPDAGLNQSPELNSTLKPPKSLREMDGRFVDHRRLRSDETERQSSESDDEAVDIAYAKKTQSESDTQGFASQGSVTTGTPTHPQPSRPGKSKTKQPRQSLSSSKQTLPHPHPPQSKSDASKSFDNRDKNIIVSATSKLNERPAGKKKKGGSSSKQSSKSHSGKGSQRNREKRSVKLDRSTRSITSTSSTHAGCLAESSDVIQCNIEDSKPTKKDMDKSQKEGRGDVKLSNQMFGSQGPTQHSTPSFLSSENKGLGQGAEDAQRTPVAAGAGSLRDLIGRGYSPEDVRRLSQFSPVGERTVGVQSVNEGFGLGPSLASLPDDAVNPNSHRDSPLSECTPMAANLEYTEDASPRRKASGDEMANTTEVGRDVTNSVAVRGGKGKSLRHNHAIDGADTQYGQGHHLTAGSQSSDDHIGSIEDLGDDLEDTEDASTRGIARYDGMDVWGF